MNAYYSESLSMLSPESICAFRALRRRRAFRALYEGGNCMYKKMKSRILEVLSKNPKMSTADVHNQILRFPWPRTPALRTTRRWLTRLALQHRIRVDSRDHTFGWDRIH